MKCLNPIWSRRRHAFVPCNDCYYCKMRKKYEWTCRVIMERLYYKYGYFVTLTYDDLHLPSNKGVSYAHADYFLDRLRDCFKTCNLGFSYYLMSEYGGRSQRPHLHMHLLTDMPQLQVSVMISHLWKHGFIKIGCSTLKSILYTSAFHLLPKEHKNAYPVPNFHIISRGLGKNYADEHADFNFSNNRKVFEFGGFKFNLPPYVSKRMGFMSEKKLQDLDLNEVYRNFMASCDEKGFDFKESMRQWYQYCNNFYDKMIKQGLKNKI